MTTLKQIPYEDLSKLPNPLPSLVGRKCIVRFLVSPMDIFNGYIATVFGPDETEISKWNIIIDDSSRFGGRPALIKVYFYQLQAVQEPIRDRITMFADKQFLEKVKNGTDHQITFPGVTFSHNGVHINVRDIEFPRYVFDTNLTDEPYDLGITVIPVFTPKPDPDGNVRYWGLQPMSQKDRFSVQNAGQVNARAMKFQQIYGTKGLPEQQLIEQLVKRRLKAIKANKSAREPYYKYSYEVRIQLNGVYPEVFRDFKVSGSMALRTFADKVVIPVMGWQRSYHCYIFTDVKDGSTYGQEQNLKKRGVDGLFTGMHGFVFVDDEKVRLGDLLTSAGDVLEFIYDLGVRWGHTITVTSAKPYTEAQSSSGRFSHCTILYGEGRRLVTIIRCIYAIH